MATRKSPARGRTAAQRKGNQPRTASKPKRKPGRPTKKDDAHVGAVLRSLENGVARRSAAAIAEVAWSTLCEWIRTDARFRAACERAEGKARARVAGRLYLRAVQGDLTALIWWQKCRDPDFREGRDRTFEIGGAPITDNATMAAALCEAARQVQAGALPPAALADLAVAFGKASDVLERANLEARVAALEEKQ